jgi:hypothetical protein
VPRQHAGLVEDEISLAMRFPYKKTDASASLKGLLGPLPGAEQNSEQDFDFSLFSKSDLVL